jgi:flagellar basal-body rod protein FlgC
VAFDDLFAAGAISASGMAAERLRMEVIANNIANAQTTRTPDGGPFRRQDVVFEAALAEHLAPRDSRGANWLRGVRAAEVVDDPSELPRIFNPGHPDADADGFLTMPNVHLPIEMVNLLTASRAYEANLKTALAFKQMNEQALSLLRS